MGLLKDLMLGSGSSGGKDRAEKKERVEVRGTRERMQIYDSQGHWKEEVVWNPGSGRWDKRDLNGNVTGHVERDVRGDFVHRDIRENVTGRDRRDSARKVSHYDRSGSPTGYTERDLSNNLTRHTYSSGTGAGKRGILGWLTGAGREPSGGSDSAEDTGGDADSGLFGGEDMDPEEEDFFVYGDDSEEDDPYAEEDGLYAEEDGLYDSEEDDPYDDGY